MKDFHFVKWIIGALLLASQADAQSSRFMLTPEGTSPLLVDSTKIQFTRLPLNSFNTQQITPIPKAYCYEDLAIFCKLEVKLEKTFKFPIKIRLGEVNYVEMLEGKPYTPDLMMGY